MTLSMVLIPMMLAQSPAPTPPMPPAPKPVQLAEVVKGDKSAPALWTEIQADPILTTLVAPSVSRWIVIDEGCELRVTSDGKSSVFGASGAGKYRIVVVPDAGDPLRITVVVGKPTPPPTPPTPPVPPAPDDPLTAKLQLAYAADPRDAASKKKDLLELTELFKQAAKLAKSESVTSTGALVTQVAAASKALGIVGLTELRAVCNAELKAAMPIAVPLTDEVRVKAAETFNRLRTALQGVQ